MKGVVDFNDPNITNLAIACALVGKPLLGKLEPLLQHALSANKPKNPAYYKRFPHNFYRIINQLRQVSFPFPGVAYTISGNRRLQRRKNPDDGCSDCTELLHN
jgi:hypothetical protein